MVTSVSQHASTPSSSCCSSLLLQIAKRRAHKQITHSHHAGTAVVVKCLQLMYAPGACLCFESEWRTAACLPHQPWPTVCTNATLCGDHRRTPDRTGTRGTSCTCNVMPHACQAGVPCNSHPSAAQARPTQTSPMQLLPLSIQVRLSPVSVNPHESQCSRTQSCVGLPACQHPTLNRPQWHFRKRHVIRVYWALLTATGVAKRTTPTPKSTGPLCQPCL